MENVLSFFLGAAASWIITHFYHRKAEQSARDSLMSARLDKCTEGDLTFLVALYFHGRPVPRYAIINVDFERTDGSIDSWGSNMGTMTRSVAHRVGHCTVKHDGKRQGGNRIDEIMETISLSERGRECAEYLIRTSYKAAAFAVIDDSEDVRLGLFRNEFKREPRIREIMVGNKALDV